MSYTYQNRRRAGLRGGEYTVSFDCPGGQWYNPDTGQCAQMYSPQECPEGKWLSESGQCVCMPSKDILTCLPPNKFWDVDTCRCVDIIDVVSQYSTPKPAQGGAAAAAAAVAAQPAANTGPVITQLVPEGPTEQSSGGEQAGYVQTTGGSQPGREGRGADGGVSAGGEEKSAFDKAVPFAIAGGLGLIAILFVAASSD